MAIKRLVREAQFPCVGKLRKGGQRPETGKAPGKDLTYFRFDSDDALALARFRAAYKDEPAQVNVFLPHQTASQNFSCWQEAYVAGGLTHRCDGETCTIWLDNGKYRTDPKPCPGGCKEVGRLMVIIPELQRFAYVTVETHSINDIIRLQENLQAVEFLRGDLRGIPFVLKRTPVEISTPTPDGKRARREKWLLSIEVDPAWAALQLESMHRAALTVDGVTVDESRLLTTDYVDDEDDEPISATPVAEPPDTTALDQLGNEIYGAAKWASVRQHNIDRVTAGDRVTSAHIEKLIAGLQKLKERNMSTKKEVAPVQPEKTEPAQPEPEALPAF